MQIEHIAIWTKDLETLKDFYIKYFGARANNKYTNTNKGFESYFLSFDSGARLEIMQMATIPDNKNDPIKQATGLIHFAMSVGARQAVDDLTARLVADGYALIDGPRTTGDGYYESVILDPEGNRIEITE
ncbi:MAG: VOC family protein [Gammaproteobacteria bacterium]|nr:VOC family protein [Gammaproteobacteria bacterium]